jgi:hypothetical protein
MIVPFLLGLGAGALTSFVEPVVREATTRATLSKLNIEPGEMDLLTLALLLLAAAILSGGQSSVALIFGALLGVFGNRVLALIQGRKGDGA